MLARVLIKDLQQLKAGELIRIDADQSRYLLQVLRLKAGEAIELFDGQGFRGLSSLHSIEKKIVCAQRPASLLEQAIATQRIHLLQGLARNDRMDWIIEKATELGVSRITPVITARSVVRLTTERAQSRQQHWCRIAQAACRQSGQDHLPDIDLPIEIDQAMSQLSQNARRIVLDTNGSPLIQIVSATTVATNVILFVGPESGLSEQEVNTAKGHDFAAGWLGPRILRTETAALAAISIIQGSTGEFVQKTTIG